jgi:hypothetical protein
LADARFLVSGIVAHEAKKAAKNPISRLTNRPQPVPTPVVENSPLHFDAAVVALFRGGRK